MLSGRPEATLLLGDQTEAIAKSRMWPYARGRQAQMITQQALRCAAFQSTNQL